MIVANDLAVDTRVRRIAATVAEILDDVVVIGMGTGPIIAPEEFGQAQPMLVDVRTTLGESRRRRPPLPTDLTTSRSSFFLFQRTQGARIGWLRSDYFSARSERAAGVNSTQQRRDRVLAERLHARSERSTRSAFRQILVSIDRLFHRARRGLVRRRHSSRERRAEARFRRAEARIQKKLARELRSFEAYEASVTHDLSAAGPDPSAGWRYNLPTLDDLEAAFAPVLDDLTPDVIHVHDVHLLGIAARAKDRAYLTAREPKLIYDAHEYVRGLATFTPGIVASWTDLEDEYIDRADHVVTVSEGLAGMLSTDHDLAKRPTVIMNTPNDARRSARSIRRDCALPNNVCLVVYSGGIDPSRGVGTLVEAMGLIGDAHLALVAGHESEYLRSLLAEASTKGYSDRIHLLPFVDPAEVSSYLSSATVAIHPLVAGPLNHEIAMPNKLFEYMHARLPVVVSNCRAMAEHVRETGIGEIFESGNTASLADQILKVTADRDAYVLPYADESLVKGFSWGGQQEKLLALYESIRTTVPPV